MKAIVILTALALAVTLNAQELQIARDDFTGDISAAFIAVISDNEIEGFFQSGNMILALMCPGYYHTGDRLVVLSGAQFQGFEPSADGDSFNGRARFDDDDVLDLNWEVDDDNDSIATLLDQLVLGRDSDGDLTETVVGNSLFMEEVLEHDKLLLEVHPWNMSGLETVRFDIARVDRVFRDCP